MGPWTLVPILGFAAALSRRLRVGAALGGLYAVSTVILLLFAGGLLGGLRLTAISIYVVGSLLLVGEILHQARSGDRWILPVSSVVLVVLSCAFWLRYGGTHFYFYDEYSHWGVYLKELRASDAYWTASTNAMHVSYLPGPSLFQYLFSRFTAATEGEAFLAQFVLLLTPMLLLLESLRWQQWPWILGALSLIVLAVTSFSPGLSSIYVDHVLGSWFAGSLLGSFLLRDRTFKTQALSGLPLTTLALTKGPGVALAAAAGVIISAMLLNQARLAGVSWRKAATQASRLLLALTLPAVVCVLLWTWNRDAANARLDAMTPETNLRESFHLTDLISSERGIETARRFADALVHTQPGNNEGFWGWNEFTHTIRDSFAHGHGLTTLGLIAVFLGWCLVLLAIQIPPRRRGTWAILFGGLLITTLGYLLSLYLMYLVAFGDRGILLPSYTRYVNTIVLAMLIVSFAPLFPGFRDPDSAPPGRDSRTPLTVTGCLCLFGVAGLYVAERPPFYPVLWPNPLDETRQHWEPLTRQVQAVTGAGSVWLYLPDDDASRFNERIVKYLLTPARVHVESSKSFWDQDASAILEAWGRFEYVWLPPPLNPAAGSPLGPAGQLLHVVTDSRGGTTLQPVALQTSR